MTLEPINLAPLVGNRVAWKMLSTWARVYGIKSRTARRRLWARLADVHELEIDAHVECVLQYVSQDGSIDPLAERFVRAMVMRELPAVPGGETP